MLGTILVVLIAALHKNSWAVIDRPYSLGCATVGALYERPRCIFCAKPLEAHDRNGSELCQRFLSANFWPKRCAASPKVASSAFHMELLNAVTEGDFKNVRYAESSASLKES